MVLRGSYRRSGGDMSQDDHKKYRKIGNEFAAGALDSLLYRALTLFFMYLIASLALSVIAPTDDSDFGRLNRSGFSIKTDALTGQEYLVTRQGGIIKRETSPNDPR